MITSCSSATNQNNQLSEESVNSRKCEKTVLFGNAEICLPVLDDYPECYLYSNIKERADEAVGANGRNTVLAVYLKKDITTNRLNLE